MTAIVPAMIVESMVASAQPERTLGFACKCGCDLFRVEVSTYRNGDWSEELICASCQAVNAITEPIVNGPH